MRKEKGISLTLQDVSSNKMIQPDICDCLQNVVSSSLRRAIGIEAQGLAFSRASSMEDNGECSEIVLRIWHENVVVVESQGIRRHANSSTLGAYAVQTSVK